MKKIDLHELYSTMGTNNITVKTEQFPMADKDSFRIETEYICGNYIIQHTQYIPEPKCYNTARLLQHK